MLPPKDVVGVAEVGVQVDFPAAHVPVVDIVAADMQAADMRVADLPTEGARR